MPPVCQVESAQGFRPRLWLARTFGAFEEAFDQMSGTMIRCAGLHLRVTSVQIIDLFRCQFGFGCTQSVVEVCSVFRTDDGEDRKRL